MRKKLTSRQRLWVLWSSFFLLTVRLSVSGDGDADVPRSPDPPEVITRLPSGDVTVRAVRISEPPVLDGRLDDAVYRSVMPLDGFLQQEPVQGAPSSEETEAWILFDDQNLYVSARLWDSEPEQIVAAELRRDHPNISRGASFTIALDTFYDRRNGFYFETNPLGALRDGLISNETDLNTDWNTVWNARASRDEQGWSVEVAIPFKSLRYRSDPNALWGIQLKRQIQRRNEDTFLTLVPASWEWRGIRKLSSAATLVGLKTPVSRRNFEVKPYGIAGLATDRTVAPAKENDFTADAGFDAKLGVTKGLTADFTFNTDFAQVEADEEQVNLTRFSLFFPEKRDFFLEGQGIFAFAGESGSGFAFGFPSYTPIMFFSRRIGLAGAEQVPIRAGGRLTGRAGKFTLGLLNIQTAGQENLEVSPTNFSVIRVSRDLFQRSNFGAIFTSRSVSLSGDGSNQVFGLDGNFAFYQNLLVNTYYAESRTPGTEGDSRSYMAKVENNGDRYGVEYQHLMVGDDFNPEVGFVPRNAFLRNRGQFRFSPRPTSISWLRKYRFRAEADFFENLEGVLETRQLSAEVGLDFESSDGLSVTYSSNYEYLSEPFDITPEIAIPIGGYDFNRLAATYELGTHRRISGRLSFSRGRFYSGNRTEVGYEGRVEVTPQLSVEPTLSFNWVDLPEGSFTTELIRARINYALSSRMFVSALIQYNSSSSTLGTNVRFRWEYEPGSDLFVVYSDGRDTGLDVPPTLTTRSLIIKLTKLVRF